MTEELKPCPFCGNDFTDIEKSISASGAVWFSCDKCGVSGPYKNVEAMARTTTEEEAVTVWNNRVPEPGTSVIRWTRYDGTPETLPRKNITVFLIRIGMEEIIFSRLDSDGDWMERQIAYDKHAGDLWAYLPEPPEGME